MVEEGHVTLDDRKTRILRTIVAEYIASAEPVGSRRVVERARLDVSAATVRNEMAALEEMGFISQPHTSAGRVPTDRGYRYFVDRLAEQPPVDEARRELIQELIGSAHDLEDLLARTSTVLAQLTRLVSLVIAPALDAASCRVIELISLSTQTVLLLLVTDTGQVIKRQIELRAVVNEEDVDRARTVLNEYVRGRRMSDVHATVAGLVDAAPSELRDLLRGVSAATADGVGTEVSHDVFVGGQAALAGERSFERDQLSHVLQLLEERVTLAQLLSQSTTGDEPFVRIGAEHDLEELHPTSLVAQRYRLVTSGSVGVLGPTRMDYASVLSTVRTVADQLQQTLRDLSED